MSQCIYQLMKQFLLYLLKHCANEGKDNLLDIVRQFFKCIKQISILCNRFLVGSSLYMYTLLMCYFVITSHYKLSGLQLLCNYDCVILSLPVTISEARDNARAFYQSSVEVGLYQSNLRYIHIHISIKQGTSCPISGRSSKSLA